jgi:molecular chaperone HscB
LSSASATRSCPHCEAPLESALCCTSCKALLEVRGVVSPFAALGLPMSWEVDGERLQRNLLRFTRLMHPDFFVTAEPEERELAERGSAELNQAFELLSSDVRRGDWLVTALGGPSDQEERQMPQAFLMEVLEWNEALEAARESRQGSAERGALGALKQTLTDERAALLGSVGAKLTPLPEADAPVLREVRRDLNAVRYIDRALAELEELRLEGAAS